MIPFYSKRNQVYPILWNTRPAVEKHFSSMDCWNGEQALYAALAGKLPVPSVLHSSPGTLVTAFCPYPTFLDVLERQEVSGADWTPWDALAQWLRCCHRITGRMPGEGNLRNFLWNPKERQVVGLDLEGYRPMDLREGGAKLIAALLEYRPAGTPLKALCAKRLSAHMGIQGETVEAARARLRTHRKKQHLPPMSGIILAGGKSRRMGQRKAELTILGKPLLLRQAEKLRALGIDDLLISGAECPEIPGARRISDVFPDRGPLGGIHACLRAAKHPACLVLSVDAPLIPLSALAHLRRAQAGEVTVLRHGVHEEPLTGIYRRTLEERISALIQAGGAPVLALKAASWHSWEYLGPPAYLMNCNTPEEYGRALEIAGALEAGFGRALCPV